MKQNILQIGFFPHAMQQEIDAQMTCWKEQELNDNPALTHQIQAIITRSNYTVTMDIIKRLPNLQIIATCGAGYDQIPVDFAREAGVVVTNTPDVLNTAVVELGFGMMLSLLRQIPAADHYIREGNWPFGPYQLTNSLAGKKVGIVGMGRIGREFALRLDAFGVTISYFNRFEKNCPWNYVPSLHALAKDSNILIIALPGGSATCEIISRDILQSLGPEGYLINIARGSVVDELALIEALQSKQIAGAALDVYNDEPHINPRFFTFENVILSPHAGSATKETRQVMIKLALDNLKTFFNTGKALTPVLK